MMVLPTTVVVPVLTFVVPVIVGGLGPTVWARAPALQIRFDPPISRTKP
jgi:hypothetical protein